jgi:hypothetical protein
MYTVHTHRQTDTHTHTVAQVVCSRASIERSSAVNGKTNLNGFASQSVPAEVAPVFAAHSHRRDFDEAIAMRVLKSVCSAWL